MIEPSAMSSSLSDGVFLRNDETCLWSVGCCDVKGRSLIDKHQCTCHLFVHEVLSRSVRIRSAGSSCKQLRAPLAARQLLGGRCNRNEMGASVSCYTFVFHHISQEAWAWPTEQKRILCRLHNALAQWWLEVGRCLLRALTSCWPGQGICRTEALSVVSNESSA